MKKAKEYAERILTVKHDEDLFIKEMGEVISEMIEEIKELVAMRNATLLSALKPIILEQDRKWKAICRRIDLVPMGDSFLEVLYKLYPPYEDAMKLIELQNKRR